MAYTLPNSYLTDYQNLLNVQLNDEATLANYLNMNEANSGQSIELTPTADLVNSCQFTPSSRRRRLQYAPSPNCTG